MTLMPSAVGQTQESWELDAATGLRSKHRLSVRGKGTRAGDEVEWLGQS
jgi:hypothetical protein